MIIASRLRIGIIGIAFLVVGFQAVQTSPPRKSRDERLQLRRISNTPPVPLTPDQQKSHFKLPEGFEIQLVLSDPDIGQPMNLNFDARGRLWVTHSVEYPYPADSPGVETDRGRFAGGGDHPPRDRITVAQIGAQGRAINVQHFADGLNIPIGIAPLGDASQAVGYAIASIFHFVDTNGDGISDQRRALYSQFGNLDVHGNASSFTRWIDGWIYGCHGFSNHSTITDARGHVTRLHSGNTYRFQSDGTVFEQFTWGQVNPFGLTFDPLGNLFSADCHSKPIYQLLPGATYPHFGSPPPPIGFGPTMIDHAHGSTGICGPAYYAADHFPAAYHDNLFICNPVTGRVHRDRLIVKGSTLLCDTQPDFITSDDPWFRPVDAIVGPDGALYVADFCNLIIGHYEAPLDHPDRDRTHGRVWRIVWTGNENDADGSDASQQAGDANGSQPATAPPPPQDLTRLPTDKLLAMLADNNLQIRTLVTNYLVDSRADEVADLLPAIFAKQDSGNDDSDNQDSSAWIAHAAWIAHRLGKLDDQRLHTLAQAADPLVRVHAMKIFADRGHRGPIDGPGLELLRQSLNDANAFVRRAAAHALAQHPDWQSIPALLAAWRTSDPQDTHLVHGLRLSLSRHLASDTLDLDQDAQQTERSFNVAQQIGRVLSSWQLDAQERQLLLQIASVTPGDAAAMIVLSLADPQNADPAVLEQAALQIARNRSPEVLSRLLDTAQSWFAADVASQLKIIAAIDRGLRDAAGQPNATDASNATDATIENSRERLRDWFAKLAPGLLSDIAQPNRRWTRHRLDQLPASASPFGVHHRGSTDGDTQAMFWDSIVGGEKLTGILRSPEFDLPPQLAFWMCGHNGHPDSPDTKSNLLRIVDSESGTVLAQFYPPRNDVARRYPWESGDHAGRKAYLEIVDANTDSAYAWIGVGRFESIPLQVGQLHQDTSVIALLGSLGLVEQSPAIGELIEQSALSLDVRVAAIDALIQLDRSEATVAAISRVLDDASEQSDLRSHAAVALGKFDSPLALERLAAALPKCAAKLQQKIAASLVNRSAGIDALLSAISEGKASPRLLQDTEVAAALDRIANPTQRTRSSALLASVPTVDQQTAQALAHYRQTIAATLADGSVDQGRKHFIKHCSGCHRIGNQGALIGPQLDGVGNRGLDRLLEDIIDPSRNIDIAFRTTTLVTVDGNAVTGLIQQRSPTHIVLIDSAGKTIRIDTQDIDQQHPSSTSVMPSGLPTALGESGLRDLLAYLLATGSPSTANHHDQSASPNPPLPGAAP